MNKRLEKILVLSIWEDIWSLGEGSGVADETHFIRHLTKKGIELHFLMPEPAEKIKMPDNPRLTYHTYPNIFRSFEHYPRPMKRFLWAAAFRRTALKKLRGLTKQIMPDLLLGFSHHAYYPLSRLKRELGIPTAVKLFGVMNLGNFDLPRLKYWWLNVDHIIALSNKVDHYIVLNDGTRGREALMRFGIPAEKISFLPNGMDTGWADIPVDRKAVRIEMGLPGDDILIVTLARLVKVKRIDAFLKAASMIDPALREKATFVVGGDGPERKALERMSETLGLKDKVIFPGVIPYGEVVRFLKASDVFAGTNELTNMSLPQCEAILCGLPVVAFDISGTSEVVRDGETGLLVKDGDVKGLAGKLELLIKDDNLRKRLGRQAAEFGRKHFVSWNDRIEMELQALEKLLQNQGNKTRT